MHIFNIWVVFGSLNSDFLCFVVIMVQLQGDGYPRGEDTHLVETNGRASKSGINVRDPISGPKCPDNIFGEKGPINIRNNEPYSVYTIYYDQLLSILMVSS